MSTSKRIALFLDYDGTLWEIEREPAAAEPIPPVFDFLKRLSDLPNVDVPIISGRSRDDLEAWFGTYPFRLIAERGASRRQPGALIWEELDRTVNYAWKKELLNILRLYEEATPGSFVEEKRSSLVWHYRKADQEFGARRPYRRYESSLLPLPGTTRSPLCRLASSPLETGRERPEMRSYLLQWV